jgi:5-(carboxyamino)imidazole ribonucleotide synthase
LLPGILKTCTLGYDGKGQYKINSLNEISNLNIDFNNEYILEKIITLKKEISIIITRFKNNTYQAYEPIENIHQDQILKNSKIPAQIDKIIFDQSISWAKKISEKLNYIGTMCVEYFIDQNNILYVNEIAPRVHNSGHLTINAYNISQFENHVRAACQLDKIELKKISNAEMINIIGKEITNYQNKKFSKNEFFFDYLKETIKDKRKMGHLTILKD